MQVELINSSDDGTNDSDQTISSGESEVPKSSHARKSADSKWFEDYP